MLIIIGYIVVILSVFGGFALGGGHLAAIFQPVELLIIGGAAVGALIVCCNMSVLKAIGKAVINIFRSSKASQAMYVSILGLLYNLLNKGRQ